MRPLSESTSRVAGKCFERKYISLGRIVKCWPDIVGQRLADKAQPVNLFYRKSIKGKPPQTRLDIAVDSANATVLHYQKDLMLERINQLFGEAWVTSIRFVHIPSNSQKPIVKKRPSSLPSSEKKLLSEAVSRITDSEIQKRLLSFGEAMLQDKR